MGERSQNFNRWRVEHARNPDTETTPRMEAVKEAGQRMFHEDLGEVALEVLRETDNAAAIEIESDEALQELGRRVEEAVDPDEVPTRVEIAQRLHEEFDDPLEYVGCVGDERRKAMVKQIGCDHVEQIAKTVE